MENQASRTLTVKGSFDLGVKSNLMKTAGATLLVSDSASHPQIQKGIHD